MVRYCNDIFGAVILYVAVVFLPGSVACPPYPSLFNHPSNVEGSNMVPPEYKSVTLSLNNPISCNVHVLFDTKRS